MKSYYIKLIAVVAFICANCKGGSKTTAIAVVSIVPTEESIKNVVIDRQFSKEGKNLRAHIDKAEMTESRKGLLKLIISYSGGCKEHMFELISKGNYFKTNPPKINLYLVDSQEEDPCRSIVTDTLFFNLENIKYPAGDKLLLIINDSEKTVEYVY